MVKKKPQTEKKKPGIYNRILKWIGLGLLVLLLIAALFFRAPWKVIALLLIILAACTVLPKPYRKWFWLSVSAIVLVLIIWVFLPDDNEGWRPYTFDEELAALNAKYAIPDSQNAATIYNQLLEDYNDAEFYANLPVEERYILPIREPWLSQEHPELVEWIKSHENTTATLIEASKVEKCHFPIYADPVSSIHTGKRLNAMRRWAFLLITVANNDLGENRYDKALEKYMVTLHMSKHLCQQPTIVDILVGIAVEALALGGFKTFTVNGDATEQQLDTIEQAVAAIKHDWYSDLPRILECGRLFAKSSLARMFYQINQKGRIRLSRDPYAEWRANFEERVKTGLIDKKEVFDLWELWVYPSYFQKKVIRSKTILNWFLIPSKPQKAATIVDDLYERYAPMSDTAFDWKEEEEKTSTGFDFKCPHPFKFIVNILEPPLYSFHNVYLRSIAEQRGTLLIVALRRYKNEHGRWPQNLDDIKDLVPEEILVDPINGGSFVYKLTEENFTLYSKGKNNIDEGGNHGGDSGADDWLIWPQRIYKPPSTPTPPPTPPPQPGRPKTEIEKADAHQSNTQKDEAK